MELTLCCSMVFQGWNQAVNIQENTVARSLFTVWKIMNKTNTNVLIVCLKRITSLKFRYIRGFSRINKTQMIILRLCELKSECIWGLALMFVVIVLHFTLQIIKESFRLPWGKLHCYFVANYTLIALHQ